MSGDGAKLSRRIDKWLWCARRFKSRSLAAKFVSEASVRVTRAGVTQRIDKAGFLLREEDEISYLLGERLVVLKVAGFAQKRGSPVEAHRLFAEVGNGGIGAAPPCTATG
ncbi:MAG: hypothetical protein A3E78_04800 [Alphaproteobacteria bacterium RIFCSPHIGHO2_12_FULL_63_12]|nr:MAG: hypothetical protein A3E78_04800 [Alphaproteobacteria bacterium RIFCSPHIGHO2_12_FULL_63_12]